ncbi:MAG: hypothetical protein ACLGSH_10340 [Acidobacteriota bacterium]|jgi:hypothetical protein
MRRLASVFALTLAIAVTVSAQVSPTSPAKPEKLTKGQLRSLIAAATTPEQHMRLAQYYEAKAQHYVAESNEQLKMAEQFKANPMMNNDKRVFGTVDHCEYYAQFFKQQAVKMQNLAHMQEQMAEAASNPQSRENNNVEPRPKTIMRLL